MIHMIRLGIVIAVLMMVALVQSYGAALTNLTGPIVSAPGFGIIGTLGGINSGGGGGGCTAATTFIARTSGLSTAEKSAYTAMICGMIADGNGCSAWSGSTGNLDTLYIFATNTTTTANLNLCSTSYGLTQTGTVTFAADSGYTGDANTGYLNTGFIPATAGGNYALNSAQAGIYVLNSRTTSTYVAWCDLGAGDNQNNFQTAFIPLQNGTTDFYYDVNDPSEGNAVSVPNAQGSWLASRTGSANTALTLYGNETPVTPGYSNPSNGLPIGMITLFVRYQYDAGVGYPQFYSGDTLSAAWLGGGSNATQAEAIQHRINGYMTALGINVYGGGCSSKLDFTQSCNSQYIPVLS